MEKKKNRAGIGECNSNRTEQSVQDWQTVGSRQESRRQMSKSPLGRKKIFQTHSHLPPHSHTNIQNQQSQPDYQQQSEIQGLKKEIQILVKSLKQKSLEIQRKQKVILKMKEQIDILEQVNREQHQQNQILKQTLMQNGLTGRRPNKKIVNDIVSPLDMSDCIKEDKPVRIQQRNWGKSEKKTYRQLDCLISQKIRQQQRQQYMKESEITNARKQWNRKENQNRENKETIRNDGNSANYGKYSVRSRPMVDKKSDVGSSMAIENSKEFQFQDYAGSIGSSVSMSQIYF